MCIRDRVEIWQKQLGEKSYDVILGVRSSIFLPFRNLGLVIIDAVSYTHLDVYKRQRKNWAVPIPTAAKAV